MSSITSNSDLSCFDVFHNEDGSAVYCDHKSGFRTYHFKSGKILKGDYRGMHVNSSYNEWWVSGVQLTEQEFFEHKLLNLLSI